jgi:hypothetical protein
MSPSLSNARIGERVRSVVDALQSANNNRGHESVQGLGTTINTQPATSINSGLIDDDPMAELFNAVQYVSDRD